MRSPITIKERKDGKTVVWQAFIYALKPGALKAERIRLVVPRSITSKSGAQRWAEQARREIEAGNPPPQTHEGRAAAKRAAGKATATIPQSDVTVAGWCDEWQERERALRVRETTLDARRRSLRYLCDPVDPQTQRPLGDGLVADLGERELTIVIKAMTKLKANTANMYLINIRACLETARTAGHRTTPIGSLSVEETEPPVERSFPEEEDAEAIANLANLELHHRVVVLLGLDAGLRASEMAGLQIGDIDGEDLHVRRSIAALRGQRLVYLPKSKKGRVIPMTPRLAQVLRELAAVSDDEWLLHGRNGEPATRYTIRHYLETVRGRAGLGHLNPHGLRHAFGTHTLRGSGDLKSVQELMGHANIATTEKYLHGSKAARRAAIARLSAHRTAASSGVTDLARSGPPSRVHGAATDTTA